MSEKNKINRTVSYSAELDTQFVMEDFINVSQMAALSEKNENIIYCPHCGEKIK